MFDFFMFTDALIRILELLVLLFIVMKFKDQRWHLFFGGKSNLKTISDHELHSCFISALTVLVFHFLGSELTLHILTLGDEMSKMQLRQFFYFTVFSNSMAFATALFFLHKLRGCTFSPTARKVFVLTLVAMLLQITQFVFHAVLDSVAFLYFYKYGVVIINIACLCVVCSYPVKGILKTKEKFC